MSLFENSQNSLWNGYPIDNKGAILLQEHRSRLAIEKCAKWLDYENTSWKMINIYIGSTAFTIFPYQGESDITSNNSKSSTRQEYPTSHFQARIQKILNPEAQQYKLSGWAGGGAQINFLVLHIRANRGHAPGSPPLNPRLRVIHIFLIILD